MSSVCVVISTPPSPDPEVIELALALATFDHDVSLIFTGAGIGWLIKEQAARKITGKSPASLIKALPVYDCDRVLYCTDDNDRFHFNPGDLPAFARPASHQDVMSELAAADHCLSF
tara:strand:- start:252138 stop:252485 length:348 start_codon:yes stop_codon:yes gene_type:complete